VLIFNPPYVPTDEDDIWAGDIKFAWKGGGRGMNTTLRVLDCLNVIYLGGLSYGRNIFLRRVCFI
jgi:methylase of polypeptide subunit release factors